MRVKKLAYTKKDEHFSTKIDAEIEELVLLLFLHMKEEIERKVRVDLDLKLQEDSPKKEEGMQFQELQLILFKEKEELKAKLLQERDHHAEEIAAMEAKLAESAKENQEWQQKIHESSIEIDRLTSKIHLLENQAENLQAKLEFEILARKQAERRVHQDQSL